MYYKGESRAKGNFAERKAELYLSELGFIILERNFKEVFGEVDLVAKRGGVFHFIEVKSSFGGGPEREGLPLDVKINRDKIKRVSNVAVSYLERKGKESASWCIDAIFVKVSGSGGGGEVDIEFVENIAL